MNFFSRLLCLLVVFCLFDFWSFAQTDGKIKTNVAQGNRQYPGLQPAWTYGDMWVNIGSRGMISEDVTGNGFPDLMFANSKWWFVLENNGVEPSMHWISKLFEFSLGREIQKLFSYTPQIGSPTVAVAYNNRTIDLIEIECRVPFETIDLSGESGNFKDVLLVDVDKDTQLEMVITDGTDVMIFSAAPPYALELRIPNIGGSQVLVGQLDDDDDLEIVSQRLGIGYVFSKSGQLEWENANGFGEFLSLGDLDQDGKHEIIGAGSDVEVFDVELQTMKWRVAVAPEADALRVGDVDGDMVPEVLFTATDPRIIHCYRGDGTPMWSLSDAQFGPSKLFLMDLNRDGVNELFFGAGRTTTETDKLYMVDTATQLVTWESLGFDGGFNSVAVADLDGNGTEEIVMCVPESGRFGTKSGVVQIFDGRTRKILWKGIMSGTPLNLDAADLAVADVDNDNLKEIVVISNRSFSVFSFDGTNNRLDLEIVGPSWEFDEVALSDIDNDNVVEILVTNKGEPHSGFLVFDALTGALEWTSPDIGNIHPAQIEVADLDADGNPDIVLTDFQRARIYDGVTKQLKHIIPRANTAMTLANIDNDPYIEVLLGNLDGNVEAYDGKTYDHELSQNIFPDDSIYVLRYADLRGDATPEWIIGRDYDLFVYQDLTQNPVWWNDFHVNWYDFGNNLAVGDFEDEGMKSFFIGNQHALMEYVPRFLCDALTVQEMINDWPKPALDIRDLMTSQFCLATCP